jgi:uncharacterized RDD family membrane protein YckC
MTSERTDLHPIRSGRTTRAAGGRRIAAFLVDYLVIAAYIGLLTSLGGAVRRALHRRLRPPRTATAKRVGHGVAFLTLTLPVVLYFAVLEASRAQATPGKRALRVRVTTVDGGRIPLRRSLVRAALKFLPWEVAHTAIWHVPGHPFVSPPSTWNAAGYAVALGGAACYTAALFVGQRQTPYDRIAGTMVVVGAAEQ